MPSRELQTFKAAYFRALAHPIRIHILEILVRADRTVQELQEALGLDQPIVSQQLAVLRKQSSNPSIRDSRIVRFEDQGFPMRDEGLTRFIRIAARGWDRYGSR